MPPQLDINIEDIQLREVQAISSRIYSPTNTTSSTAMLLEECASKHRAAKWLSDDDELMSSTTNTTLAQPTRLSRRITPDNTTSQAPHYWPISATSTEDIKGHLRPLPFDVFSKKKRKDTSAADNKQQEGEEGEEG